MENDVSLYFREIMEKAGMNYIPDSGVMYRKTLKFSSVLNIEERFEDFLRLMVIFTRIKDVLELQIKFLK